MDKECQVPAHRHRAAGHRPSAPRLPHFRCQVAVSLGNSWHWPAATGHQHHAGGEEGQLPSGSAASLYSSHKKQEKQGGWWVKAERRAKGRREGQGGQRPSSLPTAAPASGRTRQAGRTAPVSSPSPLPVSGQCKAKATKGQGRGWPSSQTRGSSGVRLSRSPH